MDALSASATLPSDDLRFSLFEQVQPVLREFGLLLDELDPALEDPTYFADRTAPWWLEGRLQLRSGDLANVSLTATATTAYCRLVVVLDGVARLEFGPQEVYTVVAVRTALAANQRLNTLRLRVLLAELVLDLQRHATSLAVPPPHPLAGRGSPSGWPRA